MCGIAGFVDYKKSSGTDLLRSMTDALLHRGPDDGGHEVYETSQASIGFAAVIDPGPFSAGASADAFRGSDREL